jgi:putative transposase
MLKTYSYRLYPEASQIQCLAKTFGSVRFVYNKLLEMRIKAYQRRKESLSCFECNKRIKSILKKAYPWLGEVNSQALQMASRNLDTAYKNFFQRKEAGFPRFKKRSGRQSFQCPQNCKVDFQKQELYVPKVGLVPCVFHRRFKGDVKMVTIVKEPSGKYFAKVLVETTAVPHPVGKPILRETTVGIDLGIKTLAVCSNGMEFPNHKHLAESEKKLARLQRDLSRKAKGSRNREKARIQVARIHEKIANQRKDTIEKATSMIVDDNQVDAVCMEDLNVKGMVRNFKLAKSIVDASFGFFRMRMEQKCRERGKSFVLAPRFYASSKTCNTCKTTYRNLPLSVREWICPSCGKLVERDRNASLNLRDWACTRGLRESNVCGDEHGGRPLFEPKKPDIVEAEIVLGNAFQEAPCL